ncbi:MAG: SDR family oxidoreductase [Chloroflexi bacterium]|nr:SDR family oxidoreductase [Chloroflexota bacterium]
MNVLVVGGAGYVGSVVVRELLERGYEVRVFDRLFYGDRGLQEVRERIALLVGDMRQLPHEALEGVDAVINLGGLSNDPTAEYNPAANREMNTLAAIALARQCIERGISRYVFASSASIYDIGVSAEEKDVILDEESPVAPKAAYSSSKYEAERALLQLMREHQDFCPVILRKGTVFGFSPRMRYDLVVNTFVKDALKTGKMTVFYGGEMWRPLLSVQDAARAYIASLEAPEEVVRGQVFNVSYGNFRISEVALRVREGLREAGVAADIVTDYDYRGVRSYRVSAQKIARTLAFRPVVGIEEAVRDMVAQIRRHNCTDFDNPRYYNLSWMRILEEADAIIRVTGTVFEAPESVEGKVISFKSETRKGNRARES